jgi:glycosyltransferase involved in cell wall biosynthesis
MKLTAIIPTFNEEKRIKGALESVSFADEILVIDSQSRDRTVDIARNAGAKVRIHAFDNFSAQKNRAIEQATNTWIFILDADERVPEKLQEEIKMLLNRKPEHDAYWIYRRNYFLGKEVRFSGWQNDKVIRLFQKKTCRYNLKPVHEEIKTSGTCGFLKNKLDHYTCQDLEEYTRKMDLYAHLQAEDLLRKNRGVTPFHIWVKPAFRFLRHFILRQGFRDGYTGYTIAKLQAYAVYKRYEELRNLKNQTS